MHFASKYILPSKPGCISHTCIFCPTSQDALCTCLFHPATQGPFCTYVYSAQQARVHFAYIQQLLNKPGCILHKCIFTQQLRVHFAFMSILSNKPGCILHTFILCPASKDAFHIHVLPAHSRLPIFFPLNMSLP